MRRQNHFFKGVNMALPLLLMPILIIFQTPVNAQQKTPLHAHVHGQAQLQLAIDQTQAVMSFSSPLDNFLGFERAPKDETEQEKVTQLLQQLQNPLAWFELSNEAQCQIKQIDIDAPVLTGKQKSTQDTKHSDLRFELDLQCKHPHQLRSLKASALQQYKGIKRLKLEVVDGSGQHVKTLKIDDAILIWP
jgi:hypothetical protein